jgi:hypothetical protein
MSADTASIAALASAERIAQLKRLQRRVGGYRSTLPVSTTDDSPAPDNSSPYRGAFESTQSYNAEPDYGTHAVDRSRPGNADSEYHTNGERSRPKQPAQPGYDSSDTRTGNHADANIRIAAAIGSLLSYIRSTETSPDAFLDPSYFQNGYPIVPHLSE